jgi:hypothetical protein
MRELTPLDYEQCQAEKPTGHSFMTLGNGPKMIRCTEKPTHVATERDVGEDGQRGAMTLCDACMNRMIDQLGCGYAEIRKIEPMYDVTVYDGKYRYLIHPDGRTETFRHGEPWGRDVTGDGFILALVQEITLLREQNLAMSERLRSVESTALIMQGRLERQTSALASNLSHFLKMRDGVILARKEWIENNGEFEKGTDIVTPYDQYLYKLTNVTAENLGGDTPT